MELKLRRFEDIFVIDVIGDLDLYNAPELKSLFSKLLEKKITRLIVNMEGVEYLDSSGVGALIGMFSTMKQRKSTFMLANVYGTVLKVLTLTRLQDFFPSAATVEEAVKKIRASAQKEGVEHERAE